jgi:PAS domain S-box-containing protein
MGSKQLRSVSEGMADKEKISLLEKLLSESEERFRSFYEKVPLGYQSLDEEGRFIHVNEIWLETLGYEKSEVVGKWFGDFLAPDQVEAFSQRFPMFKVRGHVHTEFEMIHKNGEHRFIEFDGRIGRNSDGTFDRTHCILQDKTEQKLSAQALKEELERRVEQKTLELQQRISELERFAEATVDREFRMKELRDELERLRG